MITDAVILVYLAAMTWWWGWRRGLLPAFLHLMLVLIAATLAIALWEPLVWGLLIWSLPAYAWGMGLLISFALWLTVLKLIEAAVLPHPFKISRPIDRAAGGVCGLFSGVLTSGVAVIGLGFLPVPLLGLGIDGRDYLVGDRANPRIDTATDPFWLPVHRVTAGTLATLSKGVFSCNRPLGEYRPRLALEATLMRPLSSAGRSVTALPNSVELGNTHIAQMPLRGLDRETARQLVTHPNTAGMTLVLVETSWKSDTVTADPDGALRLWPDQVYLIAESKDNRGVATFEPYRPVGWTLTDSITGKHEYTLFHNNSATVTHNKNPSLGWIFLIPTQYWPRFLMARHLRFSVTTTHGDSAQLIQALGGPATSAPAKY